MESPIQLVRLHLPLPHCLLHFLAHHHGLSSIPLQAHHTHSTHNMSPHPLHISVLPTCYTHLCLPHHILHFPLHSCLMVPCHLRLPPTHPWICPLQCRHLQHPHLLHPLLPRHHHQAPIWHRPLHNPLCRCCLPLALLHQTSLPLLGLHIRVYDIEALCLSHFFPATTKYVWAYMGVLYWATMYLSHQYLIDVVGGVCLTTAFFYLFLPDDLRGSTALTLPPNLTSSSWFRGRSKYKVYDLEDLHRGAGGGGGGMNGTLDTVDFELSETSSDDEEVDIMYQSPVPGSLASFGSQQKQVCFFSRHDIILLSTNEKSIHSS